MYNVYSSKFRKHVVLLMFWFQKVHTIKWSALSCLGEKKKKGGGGVGGRRNKRKKPPYIQINKTPIKTFLIFKVSVGLI